MKYNISVFILLLATLTAFAQPPADTTAQKEDDIMSLESLMNAKVTVASQSEQTLRETPGVVTIITAREIRNMGARDLIDVLRMVPGLDFAHDIDGVISMGIRGNWAQEAKMMLMVDGLDMTEIAYGSQQFAAHYPLDIIDRIEIIRGPGSTIYGGNASLAVINIITKDAKKVNGIGLHANYGQMQNTYGRANGTINFGREFFNGLSISGSATYGKANMSDRLVYLPDGTPVNYADSSRIGMLFTNLAIKYKGLNVKYVFDNYTLQSPIINNTYVFASHVGSISYDFKVGNKITITPRFGFKNQLPWFYRNVSDTAFYNTNIKTARYTGSTIFRYKPIEKLEILVGAEYYNDNGKVYSGQSNYLFSNGSNKVSYYNMAGYIQTQWYSKWVNVTAGIRIDKHNRFGMVAVPRLVLTKVIKNLHGKLMISRAFRAPMIYNMDLNPNINPEKITVIEAEIGYKFSPNFYATLNIFDNQVYSPIVYSYINDVENYVNGARMGSRGAEFELRYTGKLGYITANYSFYYNLPRANNDYNVPGHPSLSLALPTHKATLNTNITLYKNLAFNVGCVVYSDRFAYNSNEELVYYKPTVLLSSFLYYDDIVKGLSAGVGVYDIFGQNYVFPQAYRSYYDAVPGPSREVVVKLRYKFSFNPVN